MSSKFRGLKSLVIFSLLSIVTFSQIDKDIKVISSDNSSVVFEYSPNIKEKVIEGENGNKFFDFYFRSAELGEINVGFPQIPFATVNIGVAGEFGTTFQILHTTERTLDGKVIPFPVRNQVEDGYEELYRTGENYNLYNSPDLVTFGDYGVFRQLPIQKLNIYPIQFDAKSEKIKVLTKVIVKVNLPSLAAPKQVLTDNIYDNLVINPSVAKNWGIKEDKSLRKINNSVLANGTFYRFEIESEGIYVINKDQLSNYGISSSVDPSTIKIYNNGGYLLSSNQTSDRPDNLVENAIKVETSGGQVERIIFYARGTSFWEYDAADKKVKRQKHWFENKNYYWITSGGTAGKRINEVTQLSSFDKQQKTTKAFLYRDKDEENLYHTGLKYVEKDDYGPDDNYRTFVNLLPNKVNNSDVSYNFSFAHSTELYNSAKRLYLYENENLIHSKSISGSEFAGYDFGQFYASTATYSGSLPENRSILKFKFDATSSNTGYLDYYEIEYLRNSTAVGDSIIVFGENTNGNYEYEINGFAGSTTSIRVYDVTDYSNVKEISDAYRSGGQVKFNYTNESVNPNKFYLTTVEKYKTPSNPVKVENSNIMGFADGVEHIIIATKDFSTQAERIANYRNSTGTVSSKVFYLTDIYNEFGCGLNDPTAIRDFVKYAYKNWTIKPKYLLLFGDGSGDYLNKNSESEASNIIPVYPTDESLNKIRSYPQEDYYVRISGNDNLLDLAVGRICFSVEEEAKSAVDKIIEYETKSDQGIWRNKITVVSDDEYTYTRDDEDYHFEQSEDLTNNYISKGYDVQKIYMSLYPTSFTPDGRRKPEVADAIVDAINNDLLMINYTGHGSPRLWAHEEVFVKEVTLNRFKNKNLFFMTVASCDFSEFDDYEYFSAGEEVITMPNSGAIGIMAASRPVYASGNAALNNDFYGSLLNVNKGNVVSTGEALMIAKNVNMGQNSSKFLLLGDPAVRLLLPVKTAEIDSINGQNLQTDVQIKALSKVRLAGSVKDNNGNVDKAFNGEAIISVFDSEKRNTVEIDEQTYGMTVQGGIIFKGTVSVTNGEFATEFVVPKDISYENKNGKIVAYFYNDETSGRGYTTNLTVGGTGSLENDKVGPQVDIYFDNIGFDNSNMVSSDFKLILDISDDTGLNTTGSGIGHKLEGIIDDDQTNVIDFTNAFVGDKDAGGKSGKVEHRFTGFEAGEHKIKVKAWDVFNNPTETEESFTVLNEDGILIRNIYNFPNPFAEHTTFTFQHNINEPVDVKIKIYTVAGRLIREIEELAISDKFVKIDWNGRDEDESEIANGTYFYKLIVKTPNGEQTKSAVGKLAIIK